MSSGSAQGERAQSEAPVVGTLVSVNVGMPKDVPWQGRTVYTGVFKDPVGDVMRRMTRTHRAHLVMRS